METGGRFHHLTYSSNDFYPLYLRASLTNWSGHVFALMPDSPRAYRWKYKEDIVPLYANPSRT